MSIGASPPLKCLFLKHYFMKGLEGEWVKEINIERSLNLCLMIGMLILINWRPCRDMPVAIRSTNGMR